MQLSVATIIGLAVALIVASAIFPTAISNITNANQTGWDTTTVSLWDLLPVFAVIALALGIVLHFRGD